MEFLTARKGATFVLVVLILVGGVFRLTHFSDFLHFELDQARDARIIDAALQGNISDLPLLGPRAGGTFFRLPPIFYYLEYGSALVFGGSPSGMALFIPILSILSILIFFLFSRRYFSLGLSFGMTAIFSVSTFLIFYGRFAWNPNPLPFFLLLGFYALLRAVDVTEKRPSLWFLAATASLVAASELHSLALVAVPIIVFAFLLWKRPRFSWKVWLGVAGIILTLLLPVVLNELETGGQNSLEFFKAVSGKSGKGEHSLITKVAKNILELSVGGVVMTTGFEHAELPNFKTQPSLDIICDADCHTGLPLGSFALFLFAMGVILLFVRSYRTEKGPAKDFLVLTTLWLSVFFVVLTPIAYSYAPRFFLLIVPLPFILLGLLAKELQRLPFPKLVNGFLLVFVIAFLSSNIFFTVQRLDELSRASTEAYKLPSTDRILKEKARVTLSQQNAIVAHMVERSTETGFPVFMYSEPQHRRALKYLLEKRGVQNAVFGVDGIYREGTYFLILRSLSNLEDGTKKYREKYDEIDRRSFGSLTLFEFQPKSNLDIPLRKDFAPEPSVVSDESRFAPRYTWHEWWNRKAAMQEEDASDETDATNNQ